MPTSGGSTSSTMYSSTAEETPHQNHLWTAATLSRLQAPTNYNFKDDMEVFSPLVDVQPITPSLDKLLDDHEEGKKDNASLLFLPSGRRLPFAEDGGNDPHPISDWKFNSISRQMDRSDVTRFSSSRLTATTSVASSKSEESSTTSEVWTVTSGSLASTSIYSGLQDSSLSTRFSMSHGTKGIAAQANLELPVSMSQTFPRRFSTFAERISTIPSFSDGAALVTGSPKAKKKGAETREELLNSFFSRSETRAAPGSGIHPVINRERNFTTPKGTISARSTARDLFIYTSAGSAHS
ncbi:hypothetical protein NE237_008751 [Protea cynaroides]|uniref:Uncharacterized protein n=1 Tax=Protea cynaroides TaxID=273540 RepID=A0A9Q0KX37_9MAGN|nr:hypothetical protein NE237_008751 [Protea cynaroides]